MNALNPGGVVFVILWAWSAGVVTGALVWYETLNATTTRKAVLFCLCGLVALAGGLVLLIAGAHRFMEAAR